MSDRFCARCGNRINEKTGLCPHCDVGQGAAGSGAFGAKQAESETKVKVIALICITVVIVAAAAIAIAWIVVKGGNSAVEETNRTEQITSQQEVDTTRQETAKVESSIYLADDADLLTDSQKESIGAKLEQASVDHQFAIAVHTTESFEGKSAMDYADDYYDEHGYGFGAKNDGCILVINTKENERWISTCGFGIQAIDDARIQEIGKAFLEDYNEGHYDRAILAYLNMVVESVEKA